VGVRIICYQRLPDELIFNAIVDQRIIDSFHFAPRIQLFQDTKFHGGKLFEAPGYSSRPIISIADPDHIFQMDLCSPLIPETWSMRGFIAPTLPV
jgi:hypothetical protein